MRQKAAQWQAQRPPLLELALVYSCVSIIGWLKYAQGPRTIRKRVESIPRDSKESLHIQHFCGDAKGMIYHPLKRLCACVLRYTAPVTSDPYHEGYGGDLWLD